MLRVANRRQKGRNTKNAENQTRFSQRYQSPNFGLDPNELCDTMPAVERERNSSCFQLMISAVIPDAAASLVVEVSPAAEASGEAGFRVSL
jgi:hypothetical protein